MVSLLRMRVLVAPATQSTPVLTRYNASRLSTSRFQRQLHGSQLLFEGLKKGEKVEEVQASKEDGTPAKSVPKPPLWDRIKHEVAHYRDGTKLLGLEIKISFKLALKTAAGYELTRRENKQLQRTITDIVRLVPFSMFVIVPFAELLLPVALKLFPNLLPSTYESKTDKEKKSKSLRSTRQKVSTILRETVKVKLPSTLTEEQKNDFRDFTQKLKTGLEPPSQEQTLRVARLFKDDTVLDNLERPQLVAMSRYLNLQPIGTNEMLRFRIRYKLLNIVNDDKSIDYEGLDSLTTMEVQAACAARGITVNGVNTIKLRHDLQMWLNLRLRERIPATLLVLSNAYTYGNMDDHETIYDALQAVLNSMPEQVHHVVEADVTDAEMTNKQRIELIKEQEELIETETKQEKDTGVKIQVKDKISLDEAAAEELAEVSEGEVKEDAKGDVKADLKKESKAEVEKKEQINQ